MADKNYFSVLIAARNEAHQILQCLSALEKALQKYEGEAEILIGDDASEDETYKIVQAYIKDKSAFSLFSVPKSNLHGKVNVLAFLAKKAQGNYFLITDADTAVSENWFQIMAENAHFDLITGISVPRGNDFLAKMQAYEWLLVLFLLHKLSEKNIGITAMGNNMGFRKELYERLGGYEHIPFSVTEDFALFHAALKSGASFVNLFSADALATTDSMRTVSDWLRQRKRWIRGAWQGGRVVFLMSFIFCFLYAFMPFTAIFAGFGTIFLFLFFGILHCISAIYLNTLLGKAHLSPFWAFFYPLYHAFLYPVLFFTANFTKKVIWKGREY